jgi:hypothetical protein
VRLARAPSSTVRARVAPGSGLPEVTTTACSPLASAPRSSSDTPSSAGSCPPSASICARASSLWDERARSRMVVTLVARSAKPRYAIASAGALSTSDGENSACPRSGAPVTTPFTRTPSGSAAIDAATTAFW